MIEFISQLPTEYQEVEYIQSSGTQYIDTGVVATSGFEIDIKINIDTVTDSWAPILSAHELSAPYKRNFIAYTSSKKIEIDAGDKVTQTSVTLTGDDVIKASNVENNFYLNVNGTNYTPTVTTAASNLAYSGRTMHLLHSNGYDFGYTSGKVYYCKITVDGTLVRSFVPCYRKSDNIVGLYDLVNGVFYTNAGTGDFAKGKNSNSHSDAVITPGGVIPIQYALRRRLMSDMAKAKNIATGTVIINQRNCQELTIPAFGFNPDHVAVFTESGDTAANIVTSIFDGHVNYIKQEYAGGSIYHYRYTTNIENAVSENGVKYTIPQLSSYFNGTYRYVAWQE